MAEKEKTKMKMKNHQTSGAVYGLGILGAAVYFVSHAGGFWMAILGVLKAIVWPAILIYKLFEFLRV